MGHRGLSMLLGIGFSLCTFALEPAASRPVTLRITALTADETAVRLLPAVQETLRAEALKAGVDLAIPSEGAHSTPQVHLVIGLEHAGMADHLLCLTVSGWRTSPASGAPLSQENAAVCQTAFPRKALAENLTRTSLLVLRRLLAAEVDQPTTGADPCWIVPPASTETLRVGGKDMKLDGDAPPLEYPLDARMLRIEGAVSMDVQVDRKGRVVQSWITGGPLQSSQAALAYVSDLRFQIPKTVANERSLLFGLSLRYAFPPICHASKVVLDVVHGRFKEAGLQPELNRVKGIVAGQLAGEGVEILDSGPADSPEVRHLRIETDTLREQGDLCVFAVRAIVSGHPPGEGATGGNSSSPVQMGLVVGQRGTEGFQESFARSLKDVVKATLFPPRPEDPGEGMPLPKDTHPKVMEFDFSRIKIRHQPPPPRYPEWARRNRVQGEVILSIEIGEDGRPIRVVALKGPAELVLAATAYALDWTFEPATLLGKPIAARFKLTMPFRLR